MQTCVVPCFAIRLISSCLEPSSRSEPQLSLFDSRMALDSRDNIYVSDAVSGLVHRFAPNGESLGTFSTVPVDHMTFGPDGSLYVLSFGVIYKYSAEGQTSACLAQSVRSIRSVPQAWTSTTMASFMC
jgi:hypothetical protein